MRKCRCGWNGVNVFIKKSFPLALQLGASPKLFWNYDNNIYLLTPKRFFPTLIFFFISHIYSTRKILNLSLLYYWKKKIICSYCSIKNTKQRKIIKLQVQDILSYIDLLKLTYSTSNWPNRHDLNCQDQSQVLPRISRWRKSATVS